MSPRQRGYTQAVQRQANELTGPLEGFKRQIDRIEERAPRRRKRIRARGRGRCPVLCASRRCIRLLVRAGAGLRIHLRSNKRACVPPPPMKTSSLPSPFRSPRLYSSCAPPWKTPPTGLRMSCYLKRCEHFLAKDRGSMTLDPSARVPASADLVRVRTRGMVGGIRRAGEAMRLTDLEARLGRNSHLSQTQWAYAWLLGEARRESNAHRAKHSDRGADGNQAVDLHGALGELLLFGMVRDLKDEDAIEHTRRQLYIAGGGRHAVGADVSFVENGAQTGIDVKTFDGDPKKRYFAINDDKHEQLRGKCVGYVGLICPAYAQHACLTTIIWYDDVSGWPVKTLRPGGSPSRNLPIAQILRRYCRAPYSISESRKHTYSAAAVREEALQPGLKSVSERIIHLLPQIEPVIRELCKQPEAR